MNVALTTNNTRRNKIHPQKFALWVGCASMTMMFMAFTSAYIVRQAGGDWLEFIMPNIFLVSTGVLLLSSISLHASFISFKKGNEQLYKGLMITTFILGATFLVLQYQGWSALYDIGVVFDGNPSGSFVYVISGFHAAHLLAGLAVLTVALIHAFALPFKLTPKRKLRFELTLTFWHFLDFLWIYLITFILLQQS